MKRLLFAGAFRVLVASPNVFAAAKRYNLKFRGLNKAHIRNRGIKTLIYFLQPGDQLFRQALSGFRPQEAGADPTVLFHQACEIH